MNYLERLKERSKTFEYCLGANSDEIQFAEKQLGVFFPKKYSQFLSECGMCNFGDTQIYGIFKTENKTVYSIVECTFMMRELGNLPKDLIVLYFEEQEYLFLYKVSESERLEDSFVFGAEVDYGENEQIEIGELVKQWDSFEQYFEDFMTLGEEYYQ